MSKITKLEIQKKNKERVNVYLDECFLMGCNVELIYRNSIKVGTEIEESKIKEIIEQDEEINIKNKIFAYVERAIKTEKQVRDKLRELECNNENMENIIKMLKDYSYIDDKMYVENFFKTKLESWSIKKIQYTLMERGIEKEEIKDYIDSQDLDDIEYKTAIDLAKRKYNSLIQSENNKKKLREKMYRFLASKAYNYDLISKIISEIIEA